MRGPLLVASGTATIAALVAYFVLGHRFYLFGLSFVAFLVTVVLFAYGGTEGYEVADDLRRADDARPRKPPMGPTPPGPS